MTPGRVSLRHAPLYLPAFRDPRSRLHPPASDVGTFTPLNLAITVGYIVAITLLGAWFGRRQKDAQDYFLADRSIPWWAVCFSVVATETSALTVISVPATAYASDLWMLQLATGYVLGRIGISLFLLPRYFRGEIATAYVLLQQRFGGVARRFASLIFMVTRALADAVRIFATAIPVTLLSGLPAWQCILIIGVFTLVYSYYGGLSAVVWVDVVQMFIYILGGVVVLWVILQRIPGGWEAIAAAAAPGDKLRILHPGGGFADPKWILTGVFGGAFLTMASHGADHLIVQRLLASPSLRDARRALVASGVIVLAQFALFLVIGVGLWVFYRGQTFETPDQIFPRFAVQELPPAVSGLVVAAILAAAMSSSLNALAAVSVHDVYVPLSRREHSQEHLLRLGKRFTLLWGIVLIVLSLAFQWVATGTPVVVIALQIASFTYGGLLGGFLLGILSRRADERDAVTGMAVAVAGMTTLWAVQQFGAAPKVIDTLWFALIGSAVTVGVGTTSAAVRRRWRRGNGSERDAGVREPDGGG
ncbi:MAG TPA: sodium:solute symporter [Longimicrobiaceae bacterium]|nr:sodium:solute symporter [Longimicrobiaceae bacterium]